ncbi:right-handed parallel beta-helix repeat-containing protein [Natronorubrum texcoconense]|uniref:right-handed parallel beta-helix repeat-containing protein n=1 Tax=Natronorubrum texcoconense TaxID=1095776 RepID=UPI0015878ACC|nr:right-handed parallel beta-helix repeat-containing protein [Natronorubrum texcoconense]
MIVESGGSIQSAISDANSGDTICVDGGTYEEAVTITSGISLVAADPDNPPILDGSDGLSTGITIEDQQDVLVRGIVIQNYDDDGIRIHEAASVTVEQSEIIDSGDTGIYASNSTDVTIENLNVDGWETGIELGEDASDVTIRDSEFSGFETGVSIEEGGSFGDIEISGNEFSDGTAGASAIWIDISPDESVDFGALEVSDNAIAVEEWGLLISGSGVGYESVTISDNEIAGGDGVSWYGRYTVEGTVTVADNEVSDSEHGIEVYTFDSTFGTVNFDENTVMASGASSGSSGIFFGAYPDDSTTTVEQLSMRDNVVDYDEYGLSVNLWDTETGDIDISRNVVDARGPGVLLGLYSIPESADTISITDNAITVEGTALEISTSEMDEPGEFDVSSNQLTDSEYGIFISENTPVETLTVGHNDITGNSEFGLSYDGDGTVDAVDNWWGAENGPSGDVEDPETGETADGDGDAVSETVLFDPWLESPQFEPEPDEAFFEILEVTTNSPVEAGETLEVDVTVLNAGEESATQTIELEDTDGTVVDSAERSIDGGKMDQLTLDWETSEDDGGQGELTVRTDDDSTSEGVTVLSDDPIDVDACTVIDTPGAYVLTDDLVGSETCLEIVADDVVLNGMGHTVDGVDVDEDATQYGLVVEEADNVVVRDLTVSNWDVGLLFNDANDGELSTVVTEYNNAGFNLNSANDNEISELTTRHNANRGLHVGWGSGHSHGNTFTDVHAYGNEDQQSALFPGTVYVGLGMNNEFIGLNVSENQAGLTTIASGNSFTDVIADDNSRYGLNLESNFGNDFENVSVSGNGLHGIRISQSDSNTLHNVTASGNDGTAVYLVGDLRGGSAVRGTVIESLTATDNAGSGLQLSNADDNEFVDLTFDNNTDSSLNLASRSDGNSFGDVTVANSSWHGVAISSDSHDNEATNLTVTNSTQAAVAFIGDATGNTVSNATVTDSGYGVQSFDGATENIVSKLDLDGVTLSFEGKNVQLRSASEPTELPNEAAPIGAYLDISAGGQDPLVETLQIHYDDVGDVDESSLELWRLNEMWSSPADESYESGVNTDDGYVYAESITEFSTFGVFGVEDADSSPSPGPSPSPDPASFDVTIQNTSTSVIAGDELEVTALIENTGEEDDEQTIELVADDEVVDSATVSLDAGDEETVIFSWTTNQSHAGESITLEVRSDDDENTVTVSIEDGDPDESDIVVYGADVDTESALVDETITVSGDLYNSGDIEGTETVALEVDGEVVGESTVTVAPGIDRGGVELSWTPTLEDLPDDEESTDVTLTLDGFFVGTVTVDHDYSDIQVVAASTSDVELVEGEETHVVGSIYQAGTAEGTEEIELTATNQETDETDVIGSQEATLSPGFYHLGAINISYVPDEAGTYDLELGDRPAGTVEVEPAESDIQVIAAAISEAEIVAGEELHVIGSLYQAGNVEGSQNISLTAVHNETGETTTLTTIEESVAPNVYWLGAINETFTLEEAGTYEIYLDDQNAGTLEVEPAYSDIQVIAASASATEVVEGEELHVIGSVYQSGTIADEEEVELTATHLESNETTTIATQTTPELWPNVYYLGALNISFSFDDAGTYELELGDRPAGTVEVEPAESDIQVIAASISEAEIVAGEELHVIGSLYQAGNVAGPQDISLTAVNQVSGETTNLSTVERTVYPNVYHLGSINETFTLEEGGTYDIYLDDRNAGTLEVEPAYSDIQVIAASASATEVIEDEELYVIGSLYQSGTIAGEEEIELTATNIDTGETTTIATQDTPEIWPNVYYLGAINISFSFDDAGTYELELGDRPAGTVEVEPAVSDIQVIAASPDGYNLTVGEDVNVIGSVYQAGNIVGEEEIELTATHNETGESVTVGTQTVTVSPNVYHLGALNITFAPDQAGTYDLELGERDAGSVSVEESLSDIQVVGASVEDVELVEGEHTHVIGSVYQAGEEGGTETIELTATHNETGETEVVGSQDVTLDPGFYHLGAINITFEPDEPGTYDLQLGEQNAGWVEVEPAESDIQVIAASISEAEIVAGEELYVIGSLYQAGTIDGPQEIELNATHTGTGETTTLSTVEHSVAPNVYHLGALNETFTLEEAGTYEIELGDRNAGTLEVEPAYSDVQVIAASASATEVIEGEELYVIGSVYQSGTIAGEEEIELTATHVESNETTTIATQNTPTLWPNVYYLGALNISFTPDQAGTYELELGDRPAGTVEVEPAESDIQVIAASISEAEIVAGEELYVVGSIYQAGNVAGTQEISLTAVHNETGETTNLSTVERSAHPNVYYLGSINETFTLTEPGTYEIYLGDRNSGTLEVLPAESDIQVIAASASETEIPLGGDAYVIGSVYQAGTIAGEEEIELTATHLESNQTTTIGTQNTPEIWPNVYYLGAINITFEPDQLGTYDLTLGDRPAGSIDVFEPTVEPSITDVAGHSSGYDLEMETDAVYASEDTTVTIDVESDLDLDEVTLLVSSLQTTYSIAVDAVHHDGDTWHAAVPVDSIPDDGAYALSVIAVDEHGHDGFAADADPLVIDREEPGMSVTLEDVDSDDATVVVESDEPLAETPDITAELIESDGSTSEASVTIDGDDGTGTQFTGTLEFDESGNYTVTVAGTDRAGNVGENTASVVVNTGFTLGDGEIVIDETGTTVAFDLVDDAEDAIKTEELFLALSENSLNTNLDGGELGVGFLTAELDSFIDYQFDQGAIESATIELAIDEDELADGVDAEDAVLHHYDEPAGEWNAVDSSVTAIDGDPFVTAEVPGFSTYGALIVDEEPPELVSVSPDSGETLDADTTETTVAFEYEDALSGVDVSTVGLTVDGTDVTGDEHTSITSTSAAHTLEVEAGTSYEATVSLSDAAGNDVTYDVTFDVASSDAGEPDESDDEPEDESGDGIPGFGLVAALVALLAIALFRTR